MSKMSTTTNTIKTNKSVSAPPKNRTHSANAPAAAAATAAMNGSMNSSGSSLYSDVRSDTSIMLDRSALSELGSAVSYDSLSPPRNAKKNIINNNDDSNPATHHLPTSLHYSYDGEENCMIGTAQRPPRDGNGNPMNDDDDDMEDDPFSWNKYEHLMDDEEDDWEKGDTKNQTNNHNSHHSRMGETTTSDSGMDNEKAASETSNRNQHNREILVLLPSYTTGTASSGGYSYAAKTTSWSTSSRTSSMYNNTGGVRGSSESGVGDKEFSTIDDRMACIMRARAILEAHREFLDSPQIQLEKEKESAFEVTPPAQAKSNGSAMTDSNVSVTTNNQRSEANNSQDSNNSYFHDIGNDDGLAPLGGVWPGEISATGVTSEMVHRPHDYLHNIHNEGVHCLKHGRFPRALHMFELVLDCQRDKHGTVHEDVASALHNVGIANLRLQDHDKALQAFEEAVRVRKGALGRDHPQVAISLVKVGITLLLLRRFEDSLWIFREALSVRKHALGALHPSTARIYNNIGCVHVEFNELREARRAFEAALDIQRNALCNDGESAPVLFGAATTLCNLGYLYRIRDMHEKAALVLREALSVRDS